jgi:hypothetical protein
VGWVSNKDDDVRLERGTLAGVSEQVLNALARALRLNDAERAHLFALTRAANGPVLGPRRTAVTKLCPGVRSTPEPRRRSPPVPQQLDRPPHRRPRSAPEPLLTACHPGLGTALARRLPTQGGEAA